MSSTSSSSFIGLELATLALAAVSLPILHAAGPRFVAPVYGQFLSRQRHLPASMTFILINIIAAAYRSHSPKPINSSRLLLLVAVVLAASPAVMRASFGFSATWGPMFGPHITMIPLYLVTSLISSLTVYALPLPGLLSAGVAGTVFSASLARADSVESIVSAWTGITATCGLLRVVAAAWTLLSVLAAFGPLKTAIAAEQKPSNPKRKAKPASKSTVEKGGIAWKAAPLLASLVFPPLIARMFPGGLQCDHASSTNSKYDLLAFAESNTGYVYVIEDPELYGGTRLMRCDHSLIGGAYPSLDYDSTFGTFYFMDFVQYIERQKRKATRIALQIGLGSGASTRSLIQHAPNLEIDLVEIDPKVVEFAHEFFDLPHPKSTHVTDGRAFIDTAPSSSYDFVIHDVFTGGLVPRTLFSVEALEGVKRILKSDGVLALNFVGTMESVATHTVIRTLRHVFPYLECYSESTPDAADQPALYNMVFFASPKRIKFNLPPMDSLETKSAMYRRFLDEFPSYYASDWIREDRLDNGTAIVTDANNPLEGLQVGSAIEHWTVMRTIFPHEFWSGF
ncbi:hypothetical protein HKX48_005592 [Thoreauomyces humboldtii]|nr:hypothetical protein HKX48_005592 [Thoreauomyces humboldtii]